MLEQAEQWEERLAVKILPSPRWQTAAPLSLAGGQPGSAASLPQLLPGASHKDIIQVKPGLGFSKNRVQ